jgi:hypothetical protein
MYLFIIIIVAIIVVSDRPRYSSDGLNILGKNFFLFIKIFIIIATVVLWLQLVVQQQVDMIELKNEKMCNQDCQKVVNLQYEVVSKL